LANRPDSALLNGASVKSPKGPRLCPPQNQRIAIGGAHALRPLEEPVQRLRIGGVALGLEPGAFTDHAPPHVRLAAEVELDGDVQLIAVHRQRAMNDLIKFAIGLLIEQRSAGGVVGDHVDHDGPGFCRSGFFPCLRHERALACNSKCKTQNASRDCTGHSCLNFASAFCITR
jgi:hypothetical protein